MTSKNVQVKKGTLKLTPAFLRSERNRVYSRPHYAIWRELITNSLDAGATQIALGVEDKEGVCEFYCLDNGHGMTQEVLENVYFTIDGTTKGADALTAGGFGRARLLTCFSMNHYSIHTLDCVAEGSGTTWKIFRTGTPLAGCLVAAEMEHADGNAERMKRALEEFLRNSAIPDVEISINGAIWAEPAPVLSDTLGPLKHGEQVWADVFPSNEADVCRVWVNGVSMHNRTINGPGIVVKIRPEISRSVLTVNRDGLHWAYAADLDTFVGRWVDERERAFAPPVEDVCKEFQGKGRREPKAKTKTQGRSATLNEFVDAAAEAERQITEAREWGFNGPAEPDEFSEAEQAILRGVLWNTPVKIRSKNMALRAEAMKWNPEVWKIPALKNGKLVFADPADHYRFRVLMAWNEAIHQALIALTQIGRDAPRDYVCGFCFEDTAQATYDAYHREFNYNPLKVGTAEPRVGLNTAGYRHILACALHEVAHVEERTHDTDFASILTDLFAAIDQKEAVAAMDHVVRRV